LDAKLNIFIEKYSNSEIENENLVLLNYKYHSDFQPLLTLIESFLQKIADLDYFLGFINNLIQIFQPAKDESQL
jgi:hypothetical protein